MRKLRLLFVVCLSFLFSEIAFAQSSASITTLVRNGQRIELTVSSEKPFLIGGNTHILHIGKNEFLLNKQKNTNGKGTITFYIPVEDFNKLGEGDYVWMSYGNKFKTAPDPKSDPATFLKGIPNTWALGKLSKKLSTN